MVTRTHCSMYHCHNLRTPSEIISNEAFPRLRRSYMESEEMNYRCLRVDGAVNQRRHPLLLSALLVFFTTDAFHIIAPKANVTLALSIVSLTGRLHSAGIAIASPSIAADHRSRHRRRPLVPGNKLSLVREYTQCHGRGTYSSLETNKAGIDVTFEDEVDGDPSGLAEIPWGTIGGRMLDTVEDMVVHARRIPYDLGLLLTAPPPQDDQERPCIVVLGSGWAAHALLKVVDTSKLCIIVVSPVNHFVFTPMLASASVGTVEYRSMTEAIRASNPLIESFIEGKAIEVDVVNQTVRVQLNNLLETIREGQPPDVTLKYDKLIVAVGCQVNDQIVPGAAQHALRLKSCDDARILRNNIGQCLEFGSRPDVSDQWNLADEDRVNRRVERRKRLTFAIVGGGPTGVELAGELCDFFRDTTKPRVGVYAKLRDDIRVVLMHGGSQLVPQFDPALRDHALQSLQKQGVDVLLNTRVSEVGAGFIKYTSKMDPKTVLHLDVGLTVWAAGTGPVPFVENLLAQLPKNVAGLEGKVVVDQWLRVNTPEKSKFGSILVMGDAAAYRDGEKESYLPQTAQVAGQQGAYLARLLCRGYDLTATPPILEQPSKDKFQPVVDLTTLWLQVRGLTSPRPFEFVNLGLLAYVGGGEALTQVQIGDVPLASYAGSVSFILWRSVYLVKQVALRNRALVTFDWIKCAIFGRDLTRL